MDIPNNNSTRRARPRILERESGGFFKLPEKDNDESNITSTVPSNKNKNNITIPHGLMPRPIDNSLKADVLTSTLGNHKATIKTNTSKTLHKNDIGLTQAGIDTTIPHKKKGGIGKLADQAPHSPIIPKRTLSIGKQNAGSDNQQNFSTPSLPLNLNQPIKDSPKFKIYSSKFSHDAASEKINEYHNNNLNINFTRSKIPNISQPINTDPSANKDFDAYSGELDSLLNSFSKPPKNVTPSIDHKYSSPELVPSNDAVFSHSKFDLNAGKSKLYDASSHLNPEHRNEVKKKHNDILGESGQSKYTNPDVDRLKLAPSKPQHRLAPVSSVKSLDSLLKSADDNRNFHLKGISTLPHDRSATLNQRPSNLGFKTLKEIGFHDKTSHQIREITGPSSKFGEYGTYAGPNDNANLSNSAGDVGFDSLLNELAQLSDKTFADKSTTPPISKSTGSFGKSSAPAPVNNRHAHVDPPLNTSLDALSKITKKEMHPHKIVNNSPSLAHSPGYNIAPAQQLKYSDSNRVQSIASSSSYNETHLISPDELKSHRQSEHDDDSSNKDQLETDRKRREADSIKMDKKEADRRELEMIAAARMREQGSEITGNPALIIESNPYSKAESLIVDDYVNALCSLLEEDKHSIPYPEDFYSTEGFSAWESTINMSVSTAVAKILKSRFPRGRKFVDRFSPSPMLSTHQLPNNNVINQVLSKEPLVVSVSIFEARNLVLKDPKKSAVFCEIQSGDLPEYGSSEAKKYQKIKSNYKEVYRTAVSESGNGDDTTAPGFPKWNQSVSLKTSSCDDKIQISILDKKKDIFHGQLSISFVDILLTACSGKQKMKGWFPLKGTNKKDKQKYVGGDIYFEAKIISIPNGILPQSNKDDLSNSARSNIQRPAAANQSLDEMISDFESVDIKFNSLFFALIKACLELDLRIPGGKKFNQLLSPESRAIIKIISDLLNTTVIFIDYSYLKLVYERCTKNELQIISLLSAYERLKEDMKSNIKSISNEECEIIVSLLKSIYEFYKMQMINYKEVYPDNKPPRVLETIILIMRMIYKNPLFSKALSEDSGSDSKPQSFRDELRAMLSEAALRRYQKLKELTDPLDDSDVPSVVNGMIKLTELIYSELSADTEVYHSAFIKELDISRLTSEIYLKYFILALEHMEDVLPSDDAIRKCSESIFELHTRVRQIDEDYAKRIPGLKRYSVNMGFSPERWFTAFVLKWLNYSESKLIEWAGNAVKQDKFIPIVSNANAANSDALQHSSSIVDLFSGIYAELKYIEDLKWSHPIQHSIFIQSFAKSIYRAVETYCANLMESNSSEEEGENSVIPTWQSFINITSQRKDSSGNKDNIKELDKATCVRLCNIEYAVSRLKKLYNDMRGPNATSIIRDYRSKQHAIQQHDNRLNKTSANKNDTQNLDDSQISGGTFTISIIMAENLKGISKTGTSNPYVILNLPYGTKKGSKEESSQSIFTRYLGSIASRDNNADENTGSNFKGQLNSGNNRSMSNGELNPSDNSSGIDSNTSPHSVTGSNKKGHELIRTRPQHDTINPLWDETFSISIPKFEKLNMQIMSKNFISADTLIGTAIIDLSESAPLHRFVLDNQTHNIYLEVEPQGRVHLRIAMEGASEDTDFWFKKARECLEHLKGDIVRFIASQISMYIQEMISIKIKEQEAATVSSKYFFSLKTTVQQLDTTQDGKKVGENMNAEEISLIIDPLFNYLNKNLTTLTDNLTIKLSQEIIRRIWEDIEQCIINIMVPQLYGTIGERKVLNARQLSLAENTINELCSFFHAEGEEMGLPMRMLKNINYNQLSALFNIYPKSLEEIKRECEKEISRGFTNSLTLRCARNKIEALEGEERNNERKWFEAQIASRKSVEQSRR